MTRSRLSRGTGSNRVGELTTHFSLYSLYSRWIILHSMCCKLGIMCDEYLIVLWVCCTFWNRDIVLDIRRRFGWRAWRREYRERNWKFSDVESVRLLTLFLQWTYTRNGLFRHTVYLLLLVTAAAILLSILYLILTRLFTKVIMHITLVLSILLNMSVMYDSSPSLVLMLSVLVVSVPTTGSQNTTVSHCFSSFYKSSQIIARSWSYHIHNNCPPLCGLLLWLQFPYSIGFFASPGHDGCLETS